MTKYAIHQIIEAQDIARNLKLRGWEAFCAEDPEKLVLVCNGIGPEWMPDSCRSFLDNLHPAMQIPAMMHDYEYTVADGSERAFRRANDNLRENGYIIASARYGWYDPRRYMVRHDARKFATLCQAFGRKAYTAAHAGRATLSV